MYSYTLVHFKNLERGFLLGSMATVVDMSKSNTYHIIQCADVYAIISVAFCKV